MKTYDRVDGTFPSLGMKSSVEYWLTSWQWGHSNLPAG